MAARSRATGRPRPRGSRAGRARCGPGSTASGPALVLVLGAAGVGKSRLVAGLLETAAGTRRRADAVVCRGAALPGGATTPLLPWADALRQAVGRYGVDVAARAAGAALADLAVLVPDLDPGAGAGAGTDGRAADLLPWYVGRLGAVRPLVVVLEDLHLADVTTLATLTRLVDHPPAGVVVVATARPDGRPPRPRVRRAVGGPVARAAPTGDDVVTLDPLEPGGRRRARRSPGRRRRASASTPTPPRTWSSGRRGARSSSRSWWRCGPRGAGRCRRPRSSAYGWRS